MHCKKEKFVNVRLIFLTLQFDLEDYLDDSNTEVEPVEKHNDRIEEVEQNDEEISDMNLKKRKAQKKRAAFLKSEKATKKYIAEDESILSKISSECTPEATHYAKKARMKPQVEEGGYRWLTCI